MRLFSAGSTDEMSGSALERHSRIAFSNRREGSWRWAAPLILVEGDGTGGGDIDAGDLIVRIIAVADLHSFGIGKGLLRLVGIVGVSGG